ncbi:bifunctional hydroxymethylpyrimidine kinase/phosphomethylpyrimidine kinase [Brochothrix campestris]|uniref:Hydroxymethylpyrimidine/phosphomethylpyrimidine kinase n=1 Tax=Brochothrix campestris FSL F6-1037 TaxID=1265861 RepID=W7CFD2_9LIST|nr:bifunctional hydroxymethylpyrimidine kinase/phosphomethylpyrimidine kinase [Brochothrix campestris]EUJ35652.1 hydroxymethylpyrimidine/phosphomethylpyrimidine kinase [Brochothrix campestris FSL F6-1037]
MIACTIAGSDSGGGAGIQADLKTFQELGVFGTSVITALTAQNTLGVHGISPITSSFVQRQLQAILTDFDVKAIKTGMLFDATIIEGVVDVLKNTSIPLIVDPVMIAKGGANLLQQQAVRAMQEQLMPIAFMCTPNIPEAEVLTGRTIRTQQDIQAAANDLLALGVQYVVMKGGHLEGLHATDILFWKGGQFSVATPRIDTKDTHGTGCTFSAAITALLAKGFPLQEAIIEAKKFIHLAISHPLHIGKGHGPTNHFAYKQVQGKCEVMTHEP